MSNYSLVDTNEMKKFFPETFETPPQEILDGVTTGDYVKLCFESDVGHSERMWVKVVRRLEDRMEGTLSNYPVWEGFGRFGDKVVFKICHVYNVEKKRETEEARP